ncbi:MAG: YegS/Rv2252/BmrU family lipid kinase [Chitinophagaceae bacterium]|nr:YegS/Rv2252/BmrU family lipid kinase [Chitinophagaceae bacterium]
MQRKLVYLINPISGTKKKINVRATIINKTEAEKLPFEILDTRIDGDYGWLKEKILREEVTDVIICGGDGSVSAVAAALLNINVVIGIVPMGSGNGLALAAGIPASAAKALKIIFRGNSSYIDGFSINDKFSCMMCGMGSDAQIAHDFAAKKKRGLKTYLRLSALHYFRSRPFSFTIETKERTFDTKAFFICVANSNQFGNHVTIAPKASLNDGLFDIVIVNKMSKLTLPFYLLHQIAGINTLQEINNYRKSRSITYFQSSEATIINHNDAPLHIDGEPEPLTKKINLKIIPNAFRLLQP